MVTFPKVCLSILLLCGIYFFSCGIIDPSGFFHSIDLDERLKERDNFKFLTPADRTLSLGDEYSFIVLTDIHIENGTTRNLEKLKNVIEEANEKIKFVVVTGDLTQCGYLHDYQKFIEISRTLGVPCFPVIGNHDLMFDGWSNWKELIGSTSYRVDGGEGGTLFILDSANAFYGKDQLDWLQEELKSSRGRVFVFSHVNLFVESLIPPQQITDTGERARIVSLLRGNCDAMFTGHMHFGAVKEAGGVKYISIRAYKDSRVYWRVSVKKTGVSYESYKL
jgi:predicted phosphodiesterase